MEPEFWHARWREGRTGFHRPEVNPWLVERLPALALGGDARVLVPLCGKTLDLGWLADQGLRPVGVELSELAARAVFEERGVAPERTPAGRLECFSGGGVEVLCGDWFDVDPGALGHVAGAWDRAALIALPPTLRPAYVRQCACLLPEGAHALLVTIDYDPAQMDGPPFSVPPEEVEHLYTPWFAVEALVHRQVADVSGHLAERGLRAVWESVWRLTRNGTDAGAR